MVLIFLHLAILGLPLVLTLFFHRRKLSGFRLPPGNKGWPIIGETLEFAMNHRRGFPEKFVMDRMCKYSSDVFKTSLFGEKIAVFCGAPGNKFLFTRHNKYVTSWWPPSMAKVWYFPDNQENTVEVTNKMRSVLPEFLKPDALRDYIPVMDSMAKEQLETDWSPHKQVRVFSLSKKYTFDSACKVFMNLVDPEQLRRLSNPLTQVVAGLISIPIKIPGTAFSRAVEGGKIVREELLAIIRQRKRELSENKEAISIDLLTRLLLASYENGETTDDEKQIANKIIGLLVASHDTVSTALTCILNYLAEYPQVYEDVLQEQMEIAKSNGPGELLKWDDVEKMKYSWCVVCEAMRLSPPVPGTFREAITDFTYAGFTIPKGCKTFWTAYSTNRNPSYFPDPEKFDPSRFDGRGPAPYSFVPFGGGPRMCPGKEYARLAMLVFMHNVVTKFRWSKVNPDEKIIYNPTPAPANGLLIHLLLNEH
ncbi:hypothetical protein SADUNF_Sadunf17G0050300 [Salix dunnii]|uniref:Cytochrome P450 n=1 Tax=Salix dunnii TaxID=1413687 RepID=A0A835MEP9_9ROSI|nr:hypothetical protein SADUNF_Sadunf17G0050300 [Salix dunnii]